jgi:hypothetical protein
MSIRLDETPAERELRIAWAVARKDFRKKGILYMDNVRLSAATDRYAAERAEVARLEMAEVRRMCGDTE